eukprot:4648582-Lingulodinium_polyedra.AAC.1
MAKPLPDCQGHDHRRQGHAQPPRTFPRGTDAPADVSRDDRLLWWFWLPSGGWRSSWVEKP